MLADLAFSIPTNTRRFCRAQKTARFFGRPIFTATARERDALSAASGSQRVVPLLRKMGEPEFADAETGRIGFERLRRLGNVAKRALRYLGWTQDAASWPLLVSQLNRKRRSSTRRSRRSCKAVSRCSA